MRQLSFCDYASPAWDGDPLSDVKAGQVWRLVTPIFIHFGAIHLIFNLFMFHYFASQIEDRRGILIFVLLVLGLAAVSNFAQAEGMAWEQRPPSFGGMSGVVYGLFGYIWMKTLFEPEAGMFVGQSTVFILIAWFFLCIAGLIGNVANIAHGAGLVMGILCGRGARYLEIDDNLRRELRDMPDKFDPYRESLVIESATVWPEEVALMVSDKKAMLEKALHADPQSCANLAYIRMHTGFCRQITVAVEDVERLSQSQT